MIGVLAVLLGLALPLMGISLVICLAVDYLRWRAAAATKEVNSVDQG